MGIKQIAEYWGANIDLDKMTEQERKFMDYAKANPKSAYTGYILGVLTDPVGWAAMLTPMGWLNRARQVGTIGKGLTKAAKFNKANPVVSNAAVGAATGAGVGSLGYIPENSREPLTGAEMNRLAMAGYGAIGGGVLGGISGAARKYYKGKNISETPYRDKLLGIPPRYRADKAWSAVSSPGVSGAMTGAGIGGIAGYNTPNIQDAFPQYWEDKGALARLINTGIGVGTGALLGNRAFTKFPEKIIKNYKMSDEYVSFRNELGGNMKHDFDKNFQPIIDDLSKLNAHDNNILFKARTEYNTPAAKIAYLEEVAKPKVDGGKSAGDLYELTKRINDKIDEFGQKLVRETDGGLNARIQEKNAQKYLHRIFDNPTVFQRKLKGDSITQHGNEMQARGRVVEVSPQTWEKIEKDMARPETAGGVGSTNIHPGFKFHTEERNELVKKFNQEFRAANGRKPTRKELDKEMRNLASLRKGDSNYKWELWDMTPEQVAKQASYDKKKKAYAEKLEEYEQRLYDWRVVGKYTVEEDPVTGLQVQIPTGRGTMPKPPKEPEAPSSNRKIRRDWTPAERESMGEITSMLEVFKATGAILSHDVAAARFLRKVSMDPKLASKHEPKAGDGGRKWGVKISDDGTEVDLDHLVPNDKKKYGALSNHWVSKETLYDLKSFNNDVGINKWKASEFGRKWAAVNGYWKGTKTILNPNVHMNNVFSNVMHYDHGITNMGAKKWAWLAKSASVLAQRNFGRSSKSTVRMGGKEIRISELAETAEKLGVFGGHLTDELGQAEIARLLRNKAPSNVIDQAGWSMNVADKLWRKTKASGKKWLWDKPGKLYQWEDNIFRQGIFMSELDKLLSSGMTKTQAERMAARKAREWFVDYENVPQVLGVARELPMPFLSYMYGIVPRLAETAVKEPMKIAKWSAGLYLLNEAGWDISGESVSEREGLERLMEAQEIGSSSRWGIPGMGPTQIKMGDGFLDAGRAYAGGDIFGGAGAGVGKVEFLPESLQPSLGALGGVLWPLLGIDQFKGSELVGDEKFSAMIKQFIPNLPLGEVARGITGGFAGEDGLWQGEQIGPDGFNAQLPETWAGNKIQRARSGKSSPTKDNYTLGRAWASVFGIKLRPLDRNKMKSRIYSRYDKPLRNYDARISQLASEYQAGGIDVDSFRKSLKDLLTKQRIVIRRLKKDLNG